MMPLRIERATHWLGAPQGWEPTTQGECCHLAVRLAWEPTPDELARLNAGAKVSLLVVGNIHPPVSISVGMVPKDPTHD